MRLLKRNKQDLSQLTEWLTNQQFSAAAAQQWTDLVRTRTPRVAVTIHELHILAHGKRREYTTLTPSGTS